MDRRIASVKLINLISQSRSKISFYNYSDSIELEKFSKSITICEDQNGGWNFI